MWTDTTRAQYARADLALPSDLTDAEWALLESLFPAPCRVARPRKWSLRRIVEAILYLLRGGLPWRMLPPCFPPVSTVRRWFYLWRDDGLWLSLNHALLLIGREAVGREASPSAGVIDSQSVKITESGGPRGYNAGKESKGRNPVRLRRRKREHRQAPLMSAFVAFLAVGLMTTSGSKADGQLFSANIAKRT